MKICFKMKKKIYMTTLNGSNFFNFSSMKLERLVKFQKKKKKKLKKHVFLY